jgi:hypothetical protein
MPHLDRQLVLDTESKVRLPDLAKGTWGEPQFAAGDVGFGLELSAVRWPFRTYVMDALCALTLITWLSLASSG